MIQIQTVESLREAIRKQTERMEVDLPAAIEARDRNTLSAIRADGYENYIKFRGAEEFSKEAERFKSLSDQANEALMPLCAE